MFQLQHSHKFNDAERTVYVGSSTAKYIALATDDGAVHVFNFNCEALQLRRDDRDIVAALGIFTNRVGQGDEMLVVGQNKSLKLYNLATGSLCENFPIAHRDPIDKIQALSVSEKPSNSTSSIVLATTGLKGDIIVWDSNITGFKLRHTLTGHTQDVTHLSLHPRDNTVLVSSSHDGSIRGWDMNTGTQTLSCELEDGERIVRTVTDSNGRTRLFSEGVSSMAITPDGRFIAGGVGGFVRVWDSDTGKLQKSWQAHFHGHRVVGPVLNKILLHPSGKAFITTGTDGNVCLWDVNTYELLRKIKIFEHSVLPGTITWCGSKLICAGKDGAPENSCGDFVRVVAWDVEKLKLEDDIAESCDNIGPACNFVHYLSFIDSGIVMIVNRKGAINVEVWKTTTNPLSHE